MIVCDLTHAYTPTSGGIRTYINDKRQYIVDYTDHTHVLVIPGERNEVEHGDRWSTYRLAGPIIPFAAPYRFFPQRSKLEAVLRAAKPDLIELNTYYLPPEAKAAYGYRAWATTRNHPSVVAIHYHTDFARSYAKYYSKKVVGERMSRRIESWAARYVRSILDEADLVLSFSEQHLQTMHDLGVGDPCLVPQFIDLDTFHPRHADPALRLELGIGTEELMLVYAGRFDTEKRVHTLINAFEALPPKPRAFLVMAGNGPLRKEMEARAGSNPRLRLLPYQQGKQAVARLLATADVYVTAGPHEVAAFSVVEAQACGLPTVGVDAGGLQGRILPGLGFLGPVDDAAAMATNVIRAWRHRHELSHAARAYVERHYGSKRAFGAIFSHYEKALLQASKSGSRGDQKQS